MVRLWDMPGVRIETAEGPPTDGMVFVAEVQDGKIHMRQLQPDTPTPVAPGELVRRAVERVDTSAENLLRQAKILAITKLKLETIRQDRTSSSRDVAEAASAYRGQEKEADDALGVLVDAHINAMQRMAEEGGG